jgi:hypothetical protein
VQGRLGAWKPQMQFAQLIKLHNLTTLNVIKIKWKHCVKSAKYLSERHKLRNFWGPNYDILL